jgi:hypothetical protein
VRLKPEIHPSSISLATPMKLTLAFWFLPILMLTVGLIFARYQLSQASTQAARGVDAVRPSKFDFSEVA